MIDSKEDFDIVMPMYNLLKHSQNFSLTSENLWNHYRDKNYDVDDNSSDTKSFNYEAKIVGNTPEKPGNEGEPNLPPVPALNVPVTIPLKYLTNFWRSFDFPFIYCETELNLSWKKVCVLIEQNNNITGFNFMIISTKRYASVVTLSINGNVKFLENIRHRFKRTISWNKYWSDITGQPKQTII